MSLTARRTLSWILTLAVFAAVALVVRQLPGFGGQLAEIRWLLAQDNPEALNHASWLLALSASPTRNTLLPLVTELLDNDDPRVVDGTLTVLDDHGFINDSARTKLRDVLADWFRRAPVHQKVDHLRTTHQLLLPLAERLLQSDESLPLNPDDKRWAVAGTRLRAETARLRADCLVFPTSNDNARLLRQRLRTLDALPPLLAIDHGDESAARLQPLWDTVSPTLDDLVTMLDDEIPEVRQAAGRILVVAGDPRGFPAFCEWLKPDPRLPPAAEEILTELHGPDWRSRCESSRPTSQPG
jgi:hypothetical protein